MSADKRALERCRFALQMPWKSLASPRSGLHVIQAAAARALRERHRHCIGIRQPSESPNAVRSCRKRAWPYDLPYCLRGSRPLGGARPTRLLLRASPAHPALAHARRGRCLCAALALARAAAACAASHGGRPRCSARRFARSSCSEVAQRWRGHSPAAQPSSVTWLAAWHRPVAAAQRRYTTMCSGVVLPGSALLSGARTALCGKRESWRVRRRLACRCAAHRERRAAPAEAGAA